MNDESLFAEALGKKGEARTVFLDEHCKGDVELRKRLEALLRADDNPDPFLEAPARVGGAAVDELIQERPGSNIGPYTLLEKIGEGGFGVVFMAEQTQPVRRKVALKVLKPGMDTHQVVARFEAERQALALMDHPNIARIFEGGETPWGRPYFVMELVRGIPITDFGDQNHLSVRERLELFIHVCQAIQHAHQKGIIHRDLKPSNILVTLHDDIPVVKVIDFGIAKATGQPLTDKPMFTSFVHMMGTPMYMSPEQAHQSGLDIDTRSDVYSLGVLLYDLLTGTTPFAEERLQTAGYDEIRRIIREEDPPKPSTRFTTLGQAATTASANRQSDSRRLSQLLRGELDWIVMKALEKNRNRRYESASALAADVQRYLADEPVQAGPPSSWYKFRKFARRNKAALATAAVLAVALLLVIVVLAVSNARIGELLAAETQAREELKELSARERSNLYQYALELARRDWLVGDIGHAKRNLEACPPKLRGGAWRYLYRVCHAELSKFKHGNSGPLQYSPDGKTLANVGSGIFAALQLLDAGTGQEQFTSLMVSSVDSALAYRPDGKQLVWAGTSRPRFFALNPAIKNQPDMFSVSVWDVIQRKPAAGFSRESYAQGRVLLSVDASRVALVDLKRASICDAGTGRELFSLDGPIAHVRVGPVFHPNGQILASYGSDQTMRFWDGASGKLTRNVKVPAKGLRMLAFSPDGRCLVGAAYDDLAGPDALKVWEGQTGKEIATLRGHTGQVSSLAFSADGRRLASAGSDKAIIIWDLERGRELLTFRGHTGPILGLAFSPDGKRLASSSSDGTLRVWDASPWDNNAGPKSAIE
jgi:serine/threonine protein kinase